MNSVKNKNLLLSSDHSVLVLGIETSCDETAAAVVKNGREVLSSVISSQIEIHKRFGGVVPEIASRNHVMSIDSVVNEALERAGVSLEQIDAIAVTHGAGLLGALIVGVNFAKALSYMGGKPLVGVNHIHGHIAANYLSAQKKLLIRATEEKHSLQPPFICLVVSGGHTAVLEVKDYTEFEMLATTTDDAIGEAFDKVARVLGLQYPGGPNVSREAKNGVPNIKFVTKMHENRQNFSYSGLKTAVINYVHKCKQNGEEVNVPDVCASFEHEAVMQVAVRSVELCNQKGLKKLAIAGGVSANSHLREKLSELCKANKIALFLPDLKFCTDNAAMIAAQGYFDLMAGKVSDLGLKPESSIPL